jgi:hypothetical protein
MDFYRLYVLNGQDRVADALEGQFEDDGRALMRAEAVRQGAYAVEVWKGHTLVGRIGGPYNLQFSRLLL